MTAERKIVFTAIATEPALIWKPFDEETSRKQIAKDAADIIVVPDSYAHILTMLKEGWKMDPFFHTSGRPYTVDMGHVWVLVKGTPEEIAELNPFVELPKPEVTEADQRTIDKFAGIVDVVDVTPEALEDGRVKDLTEKGYTVFNILKGSIILVKRQNADVKASEVEETPGEVKAE